MSGESIGLVSYFSGPSSADPRNLKLQDGIQQITDIHRQIGIFLRLIMDINVIFIILILQKTCYGFLMV